MRKVVTLLASLLLAACSAASGGDQPTVLNGRVRDLAGIIDAEAEAHLTERLDKAERLYGQQVGIVTVKSLDGRAIEDYSLDYANAWGLGDKDRDDGVMILVAPNDRQVRIEVGKGIETTFTDEYCQTVIERTLLPQFRQANYARGLSGAVDMLVARMKQFPTLPANDNTPAPVDEAA